MSQVQLFLLYKSQHSFRYLHFIYFIWMKVFPKWDLLPLVPSHG